MRIFNIIELRMIAAWREVWGFWSVRLNAVGLAMLSMCELINQTWNSMPDDLRHALPYLQYVSLASFGIGFFARFIAQPRVAAAVQQKQDDHGQQPRT